MSDTDSGTQVPNTPVPGAESSPGGPEGLPEGDSAGEPQNGSQEHSGSRLHREAAAYRVRAKDAEAALATAEARVERMQTREVEHYAGQVLAEPKDLLTLSGLELSALLDDDGFADPEKVRIAAAEIVKARPGVGRYSPAFDPSQATGGPPSKGTPDWGLLFR